ncbi:hypothetical protein GCM10011509_35140 [Ornithinimicrobium pekingense]|uniref:NadR/Ttd14 AAA domain-containing protein n=1 Tax=Ornithinimicrobium pekingense TaxID=384677 RepID=A0ABQ2FDE9_9MICO|nr:hypothetical protein GCM10011509_35140 [Ornithinimicrobium pekingense]
MERLAGAHVPVMEYEFVWFQRYIQTWRWAMLEDFDPWATLRDQWTANLTGYFSRVQDTYTLSVPLGSPASVAPQVWDLISERVKS